MSTLILVVSVLLLTGLGCAAASASTLVSRQNDRAVSRAYAPLVEGSPAFERFAVFDYAPSGRNIFVYWIRVREPGFRIPGVDDPGLEQWYVSDGLAREMERSQSVADRFQQSDRLIANDGLVDPEELVAYRFVDFPLSDQFSGETSKEWLIADPPVFRGRTVAIWAALVLVLPAVFLAWQVARIAHTGNQMAGGRSRRWDALPILVACAGAAGYWAMSGRLSRLPGTGISVFAGDLRPPIVGTVVIVAAVSILMCGALSFASARCERSDG